MDFAAQQAIDACGTCGQPERAHQLPTGGSAQEAADVLFALAGGGFALAAGEAVACSHFVISDAALRYQRHLNIANSRAGRKPGPRCGRCLQRGHTEEKCVL